MLVREYLHESGATKEQLAQFLGHQTTASVTKKMEVEMPKRWTRLLDEADGSFLTAVGSDPDADPERAFSNSDDLNDWDTRGREDDRDPNRPTNAETVVGPQRIKLSTVEGYIVQIYSGAAAIAKNQLHDELAADVITEYSPQFAEAWVNYIQSDPRIMAYLEKLMIGTPLGNLIGVHVVAIGSYTFARIASRDIARAFAEQSATEHGTADDSTANSLA